MSKLADHTGKIFNNWKVLELVGRNPSGRPLWLCECTCGVRKEVIADNLVRGMSKSCGCIKADLIRDHKTRHGMSESEEYSIWLGMRNRCNLPSVSCYDRYGGSGITVCERWLNSFENFYEDMGKRPSKDHSIERLDCYKGYCPDNCIWLHKKFQARNKRVRVDNKTGATGVILISDKAYVAQWRDLEGARRSKSFSILKYGKEEAFRLACEARENAIKELNEQGAGYSENHGK